MNSWRQSLDRYLTTEPEDYSWWYEQCADKIICTDEQFDKLDHLIEKWMDRLFNKYYDTPEGAANIISKTIKRFYL